MRYCNDHEQRQNAYADNKVFIKDQAGYPEDVRQNSISINRNRSEIGSNRLRQARLNTEWVNSPGHTQRYLPHR